MDEKEIKKALKAYHYTVCKYNALCEASNRAQCCAFVVHILVSFIFFLTVGVWAEKAYSIFKSGLLAIIVISLALFVIPLVFGAITYASASSEDIDSESPIFNKTPEKIYALVSEMYISTCSSRFYWAATIIFCVVTSFIILIASGNVVLAAACEVGMLAIRAIFFLLQKRCFCSKDKTLWEAFRWEKKNLDDLWGRYEKAAAQKARQEAENARLEAEREQKRRLEEKQLLGRNAEAKYLALSPSERDEKQIKLFAELGSPSACNAMGKLLYITLTTETLTKQEKQSIGNLAISYLSVATDAGITEAEFLLLSIRSEIETHTSKEWFAMLQQARAIKSSNRLDEVYVEALNALIRELVSIVDTMEASAQERQAEAERERAAEAARQKAEEVERKRAEEERKRRIGSHTCRDCYYYWSDIDLPHPVCTKHQFHFEHDFEPCNDFALK